MKKMMVSAVGVLAVGVLLGATPVKRKVVLEVAFNPSAANAEAELTPVFKFAKAYEAHRFVFQKKQDANLESIRYTVLGTDGKLLYGGTSRPEAEEAAVNALTDLPIPGVLISIGSSGAYKADRKKFEKLGALAEGAGVAKFKTAAAKLEKAKTDKDRAKAEEAQRILDQLDKRKAELIAEIEEEVAAGDKPESLRDLRWLVKSWPSEKAKWDAKIKELSADPAVVQQAGVLEKAAFDAFKRKK